LLPNTQVCGALPALWTLTDCTVAFAFVPLPPPRMISARQIDSLATA
jgi:hypothetical protein